MRRNRVVLGVVAAVVVVLVAGAVGVALYGRGQPMVVESTGLEPGDWLLNGLEHLTDNVSDSGDRANAVVEDPENDPIWTTVGGVIVVGGLMVGFVVLGWVVFDHRRRRS